MSDKSKFPKLPVSELLRLACHYADGAIEQEGAAFETEARRYDDTPEGDKAKFHAEYLFDLLDQLRAYRDKRWSDVSPHEG